MSRFAWIAFGLLWLTASYPLQAEDNGADRDTAIHGVLRNFIQAWNEDDADRLLTLFTEDGVLISPNGSQAQSRPAIRHLLLEQHEDFFIGTTIAPEIRSVLHEGAQATVEGRFSLGGYRAIGFIPVAPRGSFRMILVKQGDAWLIDLAAISRGS